MSKITLQRDTARTAFLASIVKGQKVLVEVPATVQVMPPRLFSGVVQSIGPKNITVAFDRGFSHKFSTESGLCHRPDDKPLRLVESEDVSKADFEIQSGVDFLDETLRAFADSLTVHNLNRVKTDIGNAVTADDVADIKAIIARITERVAAK